MEGKLTLEDKIIEVNELIERRRALRTFFYRTKHYEMSITIDSKKYPIEYQDRELKTLIDDYYKKEIEEVDKRLNELLK